MTPRPTRYVNLDFAALIVPMPAGVRAAPRSKISAA